MAAEASLPHIDDFARLKLRILSVLTLAERHRALEYDILKVELQLAQVRELEDVLIECMNRNLLRGKIDQKGQRVTVDYIAGRDLSEQSINQVLQIFSDWDDGVSDLLASIEGKVS